MAFHPRLRLRSQNHARRARCGAAPLAAKITAGAVPPHLGPADATPDGRRPLPAPVVGTARSMPALWRGSSRPALPRPGSTATRSAAIAPNAARSHRHGSQRRPGSRDACLISLPVGHTARRRTARLVRQGLVLTKGDRPPGQSPSARRSYPLLVSRRRRLPARFQCLPALLDHRGVPTRAKLDSETPDRSISIDNANAAVRSSGTLQRGADPARPGALVSVKAAGTSWHC